MAYINSTEKKTILCEIRKCLAGKKENAPALLTSGEFDEWRKNHENYYLHRGYLSIWDGVAIPSGAGEIVIEKQRVRDGGKPYLIFGNEESFYGYCRNAHLLGAACSALFGDGLLSRIEASARAYHAPASACHDLQELLEKSVGLNYMADAAAVSDGQLLGSLYNYYKKAISQKASSAFAKYGLIIDMDVSGLDAEPASGNDPEILCVSRADSCAGGIDAAALLGKVIGLMDRLADQENTRYDLKDNLLGKVVQSDLATKEFISSYYASLENRRSAWRPVAFSYQVNFACENGIKYLKNPDYVRVCGDTPIGRMAESQIRVGQAAGFNQKALDGMYSVLDRVRRERLQDTALAECANNAGQIGKALSKELRTGEAKNALARALLVSVLGEKRTADFSEGKGEEYHE